LIYLYVIALRDAFIQTNKDSYLSTQVTLQKSWILKIMTSLSQD